MIFPNRTLHRAKIQFSTVDINMCYRDAEGITESKNVVLATTRQRVGGTVKRIIVVGKRRDMHKALGRY